MPPGSFKRKGAVLTTPGAASPFSLVIVGPGGHNDLCGGNLTEDQIRRWLS